MQATCCGHRAELDRVYAALAEVTTQAANANAADSRTLFYAGQAEAVRAERDRAYLALAAAHESRRIVTPEELAG